MRALWCGLLLTHLVATGCGGPTRTIPPPRTAPADEPATVAAPAPAETAAAPAPAPPAAEPSVPAAEPVPDSPPATAAAEPVADAAAAVAQPVAGAPASSKNPVAKAELPADVAAWKLDDYQSARADGDPRLLKAVAYLGRNPDNAARALRQLLEPLQDSLNSKKPAKTGETDTKKLAATIVAALGTNGSDVAMATLRQLAGGGLESDFGDQTLTTAALQTLVANYNPRIEEILFEILTAPDRVRPQGRGQVTPDKLQEQCAAIVGPVASPELRVRIAQHLANPDTPAAHGRRLSRLIEVDDARFLPAQVILYSGPKVSGDIKSRLEKLLAAYSKEATDSLLAGSAAAQGGNAAQHARVQQITRHLWRADFAAAVRSRAAQVKDWSKARDLLLLIGSMPVHAVRAELYRVETLLRADATTLISTDSLTMDALRDPGVLPLLKAIARKNGAQPDTKAVNYDVTKEEMAKTQKHRAAEQARVHMIHAAARELATRFAAMGAARSSKPAAANLPLALHPGAKVTVRYDASWPDDLAGKLPDSTPTPLTIHYAQVEIEGDVKKLLPHYERAMRTHVRRRTDDGVWFDALHKSSQTRRLRSIDLLFKPSAHDPTKITLELLWIEIPDFGTPELSTQEESVTQVESTDEDRS